MKRFLAMPLAFLIAISCFLTMASAAETRASVTLAGYSATMRAGATSGELRISYDVTATTLATEIGVSKIKIYKANGTYVNTIYGSTSNGLILTSSSLHMGTYSYHATPGVSYYAVVTVFASTATATDSRAITTGIVKAP